MRKHLFFTAVIIIASLASRAQITFSTDYNIAALDIVGNIIQDPQRNYVMAGTNTSFIPLYGNVTKLDTIANILWSKGYSAGSIATDIWDIKTVSGGGYIFTGSTGNGLLLTKIDNNGNVTWSNRYNINSATDEHGQRVLQTSDGGFVVAGYVYDATPPSLTRQDSANLFAMKVDANGNLLWGKVFFVSTAFVNDHVLNDVAEVSDGYVFGGYTSVSGVDADGTNGIILKTNTSGVLQWMRKFGSSSAEANSVVSTGANEVMVSGDDNSRTYYVRISTSGTPAVTAGNQYSFGFLSVGVPYNGFVTYDGNYAFMGQYIGFPFTIAAYLLKVNSSTGSVIFTRTYNQSGSLSLILPEGSQAVDSGFVAAMTAQQATGFNYHVVKSDRNGFMNNVNCDTIITSNPSRSSYSPGLTAITPVELTTVTRTAVSLVVTNLNPGQVVDCINVPCTQPATPTASASPNPVCSGSPTVISGSGSGTGVTYKVYDAATGGNYLGDAPLSVSPTGTTTYYVGATSTSQAGCTSVARGSVTVTVNQPPANVGSITGVTSTCPVSQTYFIGAVSGASTYTWSVSGGGTITSGQGSTQIDVNWTTAGGPYTVSVTAANGCGTKSNSVQVTVQNGPAGTVGAISGNTNPCPGNENYSIGSVANASSYTWSVSAGGTITAGQGTNQITVNWTTTGGPYTVSVTANNACGNSSNSTLVTVQTGPPAAVGSITGTTAPCPGSEAYSIAAVANATNYNWTVSGGGTITSGQGTPNININWTTAGNYTVSVTASNNCGSTGNSISVGVQTGPPTAVGGIIGNTNPCTDTASYSIGAVGNAGTYTWSVSGGGNIISGQGTTAITIDWITGGGPYTVSVVAANSCDSASNTLTVNVTAAPSGVDASASPNPVCAGSQFNLTGTATGATSWSWAGPGGYASSQQSPVIPSANLSDSGLYVLTATNVCGSNTDSVNLVVNTVPGNVNATAAPNPPCAGNTVNLSGNGANATSWSWSGPSGFSSSQQNPSVSNFQQANAGTYTLIATNSCGSTQATVTVNLQPIPSAVDAGANLTNICSNAALSLSATATDATSYSWVGPNGFAANIQNPGIANVTLADSGWFVLTATNACGSSFDSVLVDVDTLIENVTTLASPDDTLCTGATINLNASGSNVNNWSWTGPNAFTSNQQNPTISPAAVNNSGNYIVTAANACGTVKDTVNVLVLAAPSTPGAITGNLNTCGNDSAAYSITAVPNATSYNWTLSNGGTILNGQGTTAIEVLWAAGSGTYTISVTATNACGTSTASTVDVTLLPPAPVISSPIAGDTGVCPGIEVYSISNIPNATGYTWSVSAGGNIVSGQGSSSVNINWTIPGSQTVSVAATNSCGSSTAATLNVNVHPAPTAPTVTTQGDTICEGSSTTITAANSTGGTVSYNFYDAATGGNLVGTSPLNVSPTVTTVYYLEVQNQYGCVNSGGRIPVTIVVITAPAITAINADNDSLCYGTGTELTANVTPPGSSATWWDSPVGGTQLGSGTTYSTGNLNTTTTVYAQAEIGSGCQSITARTAVALVVIPLPDVTLTSNKDNNTIFKDEVITFTALPAGYSNYEFFVNGESVQSGTENTYASSRFNDKDSVTVVATNNGCGSVRTSALVNVVDFPNAFTPNNDGRNDVFLKNYELVILNRWGQQMYSGQNGWDGTYNGNKVSPGTYYYIVTLNNITDRPTTVKGTVLLIED